MSAKLITALHWNIVSLRKIFISRNNIVEKAKGRERKVASGHKSGFTGLDQASVKPVPGHAVHAGGTRGMSGKQAAITAERKCREIKHTKQRNSNLAERKRSSLRTASQNRPEEKKKQQNKQIS